MGSEFNEKLDEIMDGLIEMEEVVCQSIVDSIEALENQNLELADEIITHDDEIDGMEMELKKKTEKLFLESDLSPKNVRTLLAISDTVTDLERIADHAENISMMVEKIGIQPMIKPLIDIPRMRDSCTEMLEKSIKAFVEGDVETAKSLAQQDEEIDNLNIQVFRELITFMMDDQSVIKQASSLILISRYLERIGDHVTNICEGIIYMVSGKRESY